MQGKKLAFPWIPLAESGLFNGLQRIQIKKSRGPRFLQFVSAIASCPRSPDSLGDPDQSGEQQQYSTHSDFRKGNARNRGAMFSGPDRPPSIGGVGGPARATPFGPEPARPRPAGPNDRRFVTGITATRERCQSKVPQRSAHWSPRPIGQHLESHSTEEKDSWGTHSAAEKNQIRPRRRDCEWVEDAIRLHF
jgi:hypothetical protein